MSERRVPAMLRVDKIRLYPILLLLGAGGVGVSLLVGLSAALSRTGSLPGLDQSYYLEAGRAEREGDRARAAREYRRASRLLSAGMGSTLEAAEQMARLGDHSGARELLLDAARRYGDAPQIQASLGWVLFFQGRGGPAEQRLRGALARDPGNAHAHAGLGEVLLDRRAYAEAEVAFRRSLALEPGNPRVHNSLGIALALAGRPEQAAEEFTRSLQLGNAEAADNLERARAATRSGGWP